MKLQELMARALELSKADQTIVVGQEGSSINLRWANNTTTTNGQTSGRELFVISVIDKKVGVVGRSYIDEDSLPGLVEASEAAARTAQPAEDYSELVAGEAVPADWDEAAPATSAEVFKDLAEGLAKLFKRADRSDIALFGYAEHSATTTYLATSAGLRRRYVQFKGRFELNAKSKDYARSAWVGQSTQDFGDIDLEGDYNRLSQRLEWAKTKIELPAGKYETIVESSSVADMLVYAYWTSVARDADEGRTVFSKPGGGSRLGEKLFADDVTIYSDPAEPGLAATPFDLSISSSSYTSIFDNGLSLDKTEWVKDGKLSALITPRHWAAKSGREATPYIDNLIFDHDGADLDAMIKNTKHGLLVTCLWYIREVDPQTLLLTGLTRDGVYLIEDGAVKGAVNNFRFNMSPMAMLAQATEIGQSVPTMPREWGDDFSLVKMPPLRVKDFNMSSVSQAT